MTSTGESSMTGQSPPLNPDPNTALLQVLHQLVQKNDDLNQAVVQSLTQSAHVQTQVQAAITAMRVAPAPAPAVPGAKLTVAEPDEYDGSYEKFDHFLASLEINFITRATAFPNDQTKIFYALSYMKKGVA